MAESKRRRRLRNKWYLKNPYCQECGVKMILPQDCPKDSNGKVKYPCPSNMCTYDHIYTRFDERRKHNKTKNRILCYRCNTSLADIEQANVAKEELWKRSGRYPLTYQEVENIP